MNEDACVVCVCVLRVVEGVKASIMIDYPLDLFQI